MRLLLIAVLLVGCAHERIYKLGDDFSVEENERGIYVWDERPSIIGGLQR